MIHQKIRRDETDLSSKWAILRTSPARTVALARSLCDAKLEAWTPKQVAFRRRPRSNHQDEIEVPIAATFVFIRACHIPAVRLVGAPGQTNPHPPFSLFQQDGRVPLVADGEIVGLQAEEEAQVEVARANRKVVEQERRRLEDKRRHSVRKELRRRGRRAQRHLTVGTAVEIQDGPWKGVTGIVKKTDGMNAIVEMGGWMKVKVDTWLLLEDAVRARSSR